MLWIKKVLSFVLAVWLVAGLLPFSVFAEEEEEIIMHGLGFVTMPRQHLYEDPTSDSDILHTASVNDCVVIISEEDDY